MSTAKGAGRTAAKRVGKLFLTAVIGVAVVPAVYAEAIRYSGLEPGLGPFPSTHLLRLCIAGAIFTPPTYRLLKRLLYRESEVEVSALISSLPKTAELDLQQDEAKKSMLAGELVSEYAGESLDCVHDAWRVERVAKETSYRPNEFTCTYSGNRFAANDGYYRVVITYRGGGMLNPRLLRAHLRFESKASAVDWLEEHANC